MVNAIVIKGANLSSRFERTFSLKMVTLVTSSHSRPGGGDGRQQLMTSALKGNPICLFGEEAT